MELLDYRYFEELAQTLHFARTARSLGMSASALTRRIHGIEEELGQQLLIRDNREVRLTQAGERFRTFARTHLEKWEELQNELRADSATPTGELRIACTVTACHTLLPHLLSEFRSTYPGVTLSLITQDADRSLAQVEAGEIDLAVIPTDDDLPPSLCATTIAHTELIFIAAKDSPLVEQSRCAKRSDLSELPFVAALSGVEQSRLNSWFRRNHIDPPVVAEVRGNEGLIAMVALGSGIALVPRLVLENSPLVSRVEELQHLKAPAGYNVSVCARKNSLGRRVVGLFWKQAEKLSAARGEKAKGCKNPESAIGSSS